MDESDKVSVGTFARGLIYQFNTGCFEFSQCFKKVVDLKAYVVHARSATGKKSIERCVAIRGYQLDGGFSVLGLEKTGVGLLVLHVLVHTAFEPQDRQSSASVIQGWDGNGDVVNPFDLHDGWQPWESAGTSHPFWMFTRTLRIR